MAIVDLQAASASKKSRFKPGQVVKLMSGSPRMTVRRIDVGKMSGELDITCVWFKDSLLQLDIFDDHELMIAPARIEE